MYNIVLRRSTIIRFVYVSDNGIPIALSRCTAGSNINPKDIRGQYNSAEASFDDRDAKRARSRRETEKMSYD